MLIMSTVMINVMTVLSVLLISHLLTFCSRSSRAGSQEGWSRSQHALARKYELYLRVITCTLLTESHQHHFPVHMNGLSLDCWRELEHPVTPAQLIIVG